MKFYLAFSMLFLLAFTATHGEKTAFKPAMLNIQVDARVPWSRHIPIRLTLHPAAGKLALAFPGWLPGSHTTDAPLGNFARLSVTADGAALAWRRDPYNVRVIRLDVPPETETVTADYEYAPVRNDRNEVFFGVASGRNMAVLNPAAFALAPVGNPHAFTTALTLRLPPGWSAASALPTPRASTPVSSFSGSADTTPEQAKANTLMYAPVSLYTLIDSPILAGSHHKTIVLPVPSGDVPHTLELFGDTAGIVDAKAGIVTPLLSRLVAESLQMFGVRHYRSFHYLLGLSMEVGRNGLEHHESAIYVLQPGDLDPKVAETALSGWNANLIPHEFVHSWNGKFRRPYGEDARTNIAPQSSDLIWVYEGLTEYLGEVLMARAGFRSPEMWRSDLMTRIIGLRIGSGRDWQSLADAAITASYTYNAGPGTSLRGPIDIYYEGMLIWLEADTIIRRESRGKRSLDDFCRVFFGGPNRGAQVKRYTRADVVHALQRVQPYDWNTFVDARFYAPPNGLPTAGLEAAGWKLTFTTLPDKQAAGFPGNYRASLGMFVSSIGMISSVLPNSPAAKAGLDDGMIVTAVNGAKFTPPSFQEALRATKDTHILQVQVLDGGVSKILRIEGLQGEQFPLLTRIANAPDLLQAIVAPTIPTSIIELK